MARAKALVISGPVDAKHVSGVDVSSHAQPSMLDNYFTKFTLEPDELPSHTFVAQGNIEIPRRADTIANTIRRPSVSIRRSLSRLRTASISHISDLHHKSESGGQSSMPVARSESTRANRPLKMQSSMSRLRQKVGLDKELHSNVSILQGRTPDSNVMPMPPPKHGDFLPLGRPISRLTLRSTSNSPEPNDTRASDVLQRTASTAHPEPLVVPRRQTPSDRKPLHVQASSAPRPTRPKRADSGTAIELHDVPVDERPLGFKDIIAVRSFAERMRHYERAREYWAHADHGLLEWTESASGSKITQTRR